MEAMKNKSINFYLFCILFTSVITSCISSQSPFPVRGIGELKNKTYEVANFSGVDVSGGFDVNLVQDGTESLVLTAQENLFEFITVNVENGILKIGLEKNVLQTKGLKARINLKSINQLHVSGGGDVTAETTLEVPELAIDLSGGGDLKTALRTGELRCRITGGGDAGIDGEIASYSLTMSGGGDVQSDISSSKISCSINGGGDLKINNRQKASLADVNISGGGDVNLQTDADEVKCSVTGGGDASLAGTANVINVSVSGGGDVDAANVKAVKAYFKVNGGSDIHINASEELTGQISGGGNVYYSGDAIVSIDAKGGSSVYKK
jgi:hypothetical protein